MSNSESQQLSCLICRGNNSDDDLLILKFNSNNSAFRIFSKLLGLEEVFQSNSFDSTNLYDVDCSFCEACSKVVQELAELQVLLERTQESIQEKLDWIKAQVSQSQEVSFSPIECVEKDSHDAFSVHGVKIINCIKTQTDSLSRLRVENDSRFQIELGESLAFTIREDDDADEMGTKIKLEPEDFDEDLFPNISDGETSSIDFGEITPECKDYIKHVQEEKKPNELKLKPSKRLKRKSTKLTNFSNSNEPINQTDSSPKYAKIPRAEPLSNMEKKLLKRWGLDDSTRLRVTLEKLKENGIKENITKSRARSHKRRKRIPNHKDKITEMTETSLYTPGINTCSDHVIKQSDFRTELKVIESDLLLDHKEDMNDPDFDLSLNSPPEYSSGDDQIDSASVKDWKPKLKKRIVRKLKPKKRIFVNGIIKRRQKIAKPQSSLIILTDGKMYFQGREIIQKENFLHCTYETCDFKLEKNGSDQDCSKLMLQHLKKQHIGSGEYGCRRCDLLFKNNHEYQDHFAASHSEESIVKQSRNSNIGGISELKTLGIDKQICYICLRPLHKSHHLIKHLWTHFSEDDKAAWIASGKINPLESDLKSQEKKKQELGFQCITCGKRFPFFCNLKAHELTHAEKTEREQYICNTCGKIFTTMNGLKFHDGRLHNPDQLLGKWKFCRICDAKFLSKTHYDTHMMRHHGAEKTYNCKKCDKKFSDLSSLKLHDFAHMPPDWRPYQCKHCPMSYRHTKNLKRHLKSVHKDKLDPSTTDNPIVSNKPIILTCKQMFPCPECDKPFPMPSRLKKHQKNKGHGFSEDQP